MSNYEIHNEQTWEIYDPANAKLVAIFYDEDQAKLFTEATKIREAMRRTSELIASSLGCLERIGVIQRAPRKVRRLGEYERDAVWTWGVYRYTWNAEKGRWHRAFKDSGKFNGDPVAPTLIGDDDYFVEEITREPRKVHRLTETERDATWTWDGGHFGGPYRYVWSAGANTWKVYQDGHLAWKSNTPSLGNTGVDGFFVEEVA